MVKTRKTWLWITAGSAVTCGLCGITLYNGLGKPARDFDGELSKGVAVGLPSDPDAYQRKISPDQNAAADYRKASEAWKQFTIGHKDAAKHLQAGVLGQDVTHSEMSGALLEAEPIFALMDKAATKPDLCLDWKYSQGYEALFPEFSIFKNLVRLRCQQARVMAAKGDFPAAFASLKKAAGISRHLAADNQTLLHLLVQIALRAIIERNLEQILCEQGRNSNAFRNAESVLTAFGPALEMGRAMRGEYASMLGTLKMLEDPVKRSEISRSYESWEEDEPESGSPPSMLDWPTLRYVMQANLVKVMRQVYLDLADKDNKSMKVVRTAEAIDSRIGAAQGPLDYLTSMMVSAYKSVAESVVGVEAQERLIRILAASLSQPSGVKIPEGQGIDTFTDKPFARKIKGKSFRFWSVVRDLNDNGGLSIRPESFRGEFDVVVGYPYVEKTRKKVRAVPSSVPGGGPPRPGDDE